MRILITAGNTQTPIDDVRVITNVFSGRTGSQIALAAHQRGHSVCLLTSHPELVERASAELSPDARLGECNVHPYRTFDDLRMLMEQLITGSSFDAIVHCAAVSDYQLAGTYTVAKETFFDFQSAMWKTRSVDGNSLAPEPALLDVSAGKIKSSYQELWLRMIPTPKLVDLIREPWGFKGVLVKFKLEVGPTDEELIRIAETSRTHSHADLIVANTYSGMKTYAFLGPVDGQYLRLDRSDLAPTLLERLEKMCAYKRK